MRPAAERLLRRLGAPGVLGIGVLIGCGGFWASTLQPLEAALAEQRTAERMRARTPYQPVAATDVLDDLRRFRKLFPGTENLADEMERLHRMARGAGLDLAQGEYRLERPAAGLWAYRVTLPVTGTYPQLRDFLAALLDGMPAASIDALRFERERAAATQVEAQVRITLYVRPPGESP